MAADGESEAVVDRGYPLANGADPCVIRTPLYRGPVDGDEALIRRLQDRARDPARRVDDAPSQFDLRVQAMSLGELLSGSQAMAADLNRLVGMLQAGERVDDDLRDKARAIEEEIGTRAEPRPLPEPASDEALTALEQDVGRPLPQFIRRVYLDVADGGFGPRGGLLSVAGIRSAYAELRSESPSEIEDETWPPQLVPLVATDAGHECVDLTSGRIVESDFDEVERDGEVVYGLVIRDSAETPQAWLSAWLGTG